MDVNEFRQRVMAKTDAPHGTPYDYVHPSTPADRVEMQDPGDTAVLTEYGDEKERQLTRDDFETEEAFQDFMARGGNPNT